MTYPAMLEWAGCVFGVLGATLLATNTRWSRYGWIPFLVSNVFWIGLAQEDNKHGLLTQQLVFTATSLLGIYRWTLNNGPDLVLVARNRRQKDILSWALRTFGEQTAGNREERVLRFVEESIELAQAEGMTQAVVTDLTRYVFARPAGDPAQEVGGVAVTLLAYCELAGFSAEELEQREWSRVQAKDAAQWRKRHNAKALAGIAVPSTEGGA